MCKPASSLRCKESPTPDDRPQTVSSNNHHNILRIPSRNLRPSSQSITFLPDHIPIPIFGQRCRFSISQLKFSSRFYRISTVPGSSTFNLTESTSIFQKHGPLTVTPTINMSPILLFHQQALSSSAGSSIALLLVSNGQASQAYLISSKFRTQSIQHQVFCLFHQSGMLCSRTSRPSGFRNARCGIPHTRL